MIVNTSNELTEQTDRSFEASSQSFPLEDDPNVIRPNRKQLDLEGIRELIIEMRI